MNDLEAHEEIHKRYTAALARSMQDTKAMLLRNLIDEAITLPTHEIKVDFDGKD